MLPLSPGTGSTSFGKGSLCKAVGASCAQPLWHDAGLVGAGSGRAGAGAGGGGGEGEAVVYGLVWRQ
jgi:hypothetical protein